MSIVCCPKCGKDDLIRKVSSIVGAGDYTGRSSAVTSAVDLHGDIAMGVTDTDSHLTSRIARVLAPPSMPAVRQKDDLTTLPYMFGCFAVVFLFIAFAASSFFFGLLGFVFGVGILIVINMRSSQARNVESRMPTWQEAMRRWDRLYYCSRDDLVIDPMTGKCSPPHELSNILYGE